MYKMMPGFVKIVYICPQTFDWRIHRKVLTEFVSRWGDYKWFLIFSLEVCVFAKIFLSDEHSLLLLKKK